MKPIKPKYRKANKLLMAMPTNDATTPLEFVNNIIAMFLEYGLYPDGHMVCGMGGGD